MRRVFNFEAVINGQKEENTTPSKISVLRITLDSEKSKKMNEKCVSIVEDAFIKWGETELSNDETLSLIKKGMSEILDGPMSFSAESSTEKITIPVPIVTPIKNKENEDEIQGIAVSIAAQEIETEIYEVLVELPK